MRTKPTTNYFSFDRQKRTLQTSFESYEDRLNRQKSIEKVVFSDVASTSPMVSYD